MDTQATLAEDNVLLLVDTNSICRLCLRSGGALSDIFDQQIDPKIIQNITAFSNINITLDDNLPLKICHKCRFMVEACCKFRSLILHSNKILLQTITDENDKNTSKNKTETVSELLENKSKKRKLFNDDDLDIEDEVCSNYNVFNDNSICKETDIKMEDITTLQIDQSISTDNLYDIHNIINNNKLIQCQLCLDSWLDEDHINQHIDDHVEGTGLDPYYKLGESNIICVVCDKKFNYRCSFLIHQREHLNLKPYLCRYEGCNGSFHSKSRLKHHLPIHDKRNFICFECGVAFKRKSDLIAHEKIHKDADIKYECPICGCICKTRFTKAAHMKKHQNDIDQNVTQENHEASSSIPKKNKIDPNIFILSNRSMQCLLCFQSCKDEQSLIKHIDDHVEGTGLEPYYKLGESNILCKLCDKTFSYRFKFLDHQREHLCLKPFQCKHKDCGSSFISKTGLRHHIPIHADRNYICSTCAVGFKRKSELTAHEKIHEDATKKYECPICGFLCKTRFTLTIHIKKHKKQRKFQCASCTKEYFTQSELRRHEFIHAPSKCFTCNQCAAAYYSKCALVRHIKVRHSDNDFECQLCKQLHKRISVKTYKKHILKPKEYSFRCNVCGQGYFEEICLNKHNECCSSIIDTNIETFI